MLVGCSLVTDPDQFEIEFVDAALDGGADTNDDGGDDAGVDAPEVRTDSGVADSGARDVGIDALLSCGAVPPPEDGTPFCCATDANCASAPGPSGQTCRGAMCDRGLHGTCFPAPPPGGCFVDEDCDAAETCRDAPNCGCTVPCTSMPTPGTCA
jgi:hypothetical protein